MSNLTGLTLGVDPGRQKTGLALVDEAGTILWRSIVDPNTLGQALNPLLGQYSVTRIVLGNSTSSRDAELQIRRFLSDKSLHLPLSIVDESGSTLEARDLYWKAKPPRGWRRLVPISLQNPPESIDDFAAAVIALRG